LSRTQEEYSAGHVEGAVNIPYLVKAGPGMYSNFSNNPLEVLKNDDFFFLAVSVLVHN
jgi:hypothetical protein